MKATQARLRAWGGVAEPITLCQQPTFSHQLGAALQRPAPSHLVVGNLRSYGDEVLNPDGHFIQTTHCDRVLHFDRRNGVVQVESGITLAALQRIIAPHGWMLPVTPGTALLTVGGAIANDVHGKNHHTAGTFGQHVRELGLVRSDGQVLRCGPTEQADWFAATLGGMGLTGAITEATLQLRPSGSGLLNIENHRFANLDGFFALDALHTPQHEYAVAWIDCAAQGRQLGRGIFSVADHQPSAGEVPPAVLPPSAAALRQRTVPCELPVSLINSLSLRPFNWFYYHRPGVGLPAHTQQSMYQWLYPLDRIQHWNRLYGRAGFVQFQCVIPPQHARDALQEMLTTIARSGTGSFLAVLKNFGNQRSPGLLSFPMPGTTLALDFPWQGQATATLLAQLHAINLAAKGRIYAAKDSHAPAHALAAGYPELATFSRYLDPKLQSRMRQRFGL
ncbi:FAD-binding oxidoreductase [Parvibium lacunae]|uniref:FAD-binding oxidoreductase n=2 Tax=Parvibium lacunae TaxID=1888893 RepID=A0A368KZ71_9BURK|nr:FAD-binding oxidoreductase [Parvibium lacunae]